MRKAVTVLVILAMMLTLVVIPAQAAEDPEAAE